MEERAFGEQLFPSGFCDASAIVVGRRKLLARREQSDDRALAIAIAV
jgi:hypothetical protein